MPPRRKIFVSYHHDNDQNYYDAFSKQFNDTYEAVHDNSVDREIESNDPEYIIRRIREDYISGTSCTLVLCGSETPLRKYVDWEIKATLDKQHGLIGVNLPNSKRSNQEKVIVPSRLHDNIQSGYALWINWSALTVNNLKRYIEVANNKPTNLIVNTRELKSRNG